MKAVVLAAGEGRRLRPLTYIKPKVLLPVAGNPLLHYGLQALKRLGVKDVAIVVNPSSGVPEVFGRGEVYGLRIEYVVQDKPLGIRDALLTAASSISDRPLLIYNGDNIYRSLSSALIHADEAEAVFTVDELKFPDRPAAAKLEGRRIVKLGGAGCNVSLEGAYRLSGVALDAVKRFPPYKWDDWGLMRGLRWALKKGYVMTGIWVKGHAVNVNDLKSFLEANRLVLKRLLKKRSYLGVGCRINESAQLRGYVSIGDHCVVDSGAVVEDSVILDGAVVHRDAYVKSCVVGENMVVEKGSRIEGLIWS